MLDADLPVHPPVAFGSMQAYALCTVRNYAMMAIHEGCSEDQIFGSWSMASTVPNRPGQSVSITPNRSRL
jgi:hypothetical protein